MGNFFWLSKNQESECGETKKSGDNLKYLIMAHDNS